MRLTTRGRIVAGIVVVAFLWGSVFGIQAMSAIVIPGVLALGASWLLVGKADRIGIDRRPPEPGFPGDRRTVTMTVRSPEWLTAMVDDELPTGVQALRRNGGRPVKRGQVRYEVVSERRGVETLGPARVVVSDPFGLVAEDFLTDATTTLMTYPTVRPIQSIRNAPDLLPEGGAMRDRHEFDRLREYERGDAPRDIHWKTSAKRACDPLIVKEFISDADAGDVRIVAGSEPGGEDEMASATASIACHLLDTGVGVGVRTRDEDVPVKAGDPHRREILAALARTEGGHVVQETGESGSMFVHADENGDVDVRLGMRSVAFTNLTSSSADQPAVLADGGSS